MIYFSICSLIHDVVVKQQLLLDSQLNRQKPFKIMHWIKQQRLRETVVYEGVPLARALSKSYLDAKLTVSNRLMLRWLEKKDIKSMIKIFLSIGCTLRPSSRIKKLI